MKKVKKIAVLLMLVVLASTMLNSCKKGADDPFISFRSRDGRITAIWKLTQIDGTVVYYFGSSSVSTTIKYDGTTLLQTSTPGGATSASGSYEMTIAKEGKISFSETYTTTGGTADVESGEGHWHWINSDKNKNYIQLDGGSNLFQAGIYYVDKLGGSELILKSNSKDVNNGHTNSTDITYTFEKQ